MISFPFHHWMSSSDFNKMIKITNHLIAKFKRNNVKNHYKRIKSDFKK